MSSATRVVLLNKLTVAAPALADNDLIPVLTHFWFSGKDVTAYNDQIGVVMPLETELVGAVPGKTLLSLLKNTTAKEVTFIVEDTSVILKASRSKLNLPLLPPSAFDRMFTMPTASDKTIVPKNPKQMVMAFEHCLRAVGTGTDVPDQLGITVIPDGKVLHLYSTNMATMAYSRVVLAETCPLKSRVILPTRFVTTMLEMGVGDDFHFELTSNYALFLGPAGSKLFGRLIESEAPIPFQRHMDKHFTEEAEKMLVPIPEQLLLALERATVITDAANNQSQTEFTVKQFAPEGKKPYQRLTLFSKSDRGEVTDHVELGPDQADVSVRLEAKYLKSAIASFDKIVFLPQSVVLTRSDMVYMVSGS